MNNQAVRLEQLTTGGVAARLLPPQQFSPQQPIVIGRDPSCNVTLDVNQYTSVSRRHLTIRATSDGWWEIADLGSANGTYVNGRRISQPQRLNSGDRFSLGYDGPEFILEYVAQPQIDTAASFKPVRENQPHQTSDYQPNFTYSESPPNAYDTGISFTQLFPIASKGRDLTTKAFLVPAIFTVLFVVAMFISIGQPGFFFLLAVYIAGIAYYFIYRLCGKHKPWWVLCASGITTVVILVSPLLAVFITIFRGLLPGTIPNNPETVGIVQLFTAHFFGAGLMEELLKAVPIGLAYWFGKTFNSRKIGVSEPLDGILLGTASAVGFTLVETLWQYVPNIINQSAVQLGTGAAQLLGLQLLIPRILGSVAGHMAYSGYFGYFIGLSVLKPKKAMIILPIGYLTASLLHALWNTFGSYSSLVLALVGVLSYAFLAAAILKARELSPTRAQNFATTFNTKGR